MTHKPTDMKITMAGNLKEHGAGANTFRPATDDDLDHQLFARNMKIWEQHFAEVANIFSQMEPAEIYLLINDEGDFDISYLGKPLLGMGSRKMASEGVKSFHKTHRLIDPSTYCAEGVENEIVNRIRERVGNELDSPPPARPVGMECYHLVILGFGLGDQVPPMAEITKCHNMILVEPKLEFLYLSLFTFDWETFLGKYSTTQKRLQIILDQNAVDIELRIRDCVKPISPHYADGTTLVNAYPETVLDKAFKMIVDNAWFLSSPVGFFMDECDMMRNAYSNLKDHKGYYYQRRDAKLPLPVFIVGSGPSLDESIDVIRENQDRAAIVSCGTALRILLDKGIMPDFHVEMENTPEIADIIASGAKSHDISSITLIASFTVVPGVGKHFTDPVYYFRSNLAPTPIFFLGKDTWIEHSTPTVANLGFSFAQEFGFQDIYMFGVDLGARDIERHHAEGSVYHDDGVEVPYDDVLDIEMPANFGGGDILTDTVFLWAKDSLQHAVRRFPTQRTYYNCSDGLKIDGITPLPASEISLPGQPPKRDVIKQAVSSFPRYSSEHFRRAWNKKDRQSKLLQYRDSLLSCLDTGQPGDGTKQTPDGPMPGANRQERRRLAKLAKKQNQAPDGRAAGNAPSNGEATTAFYSDYMVNLTGRFYPETGKNTVEDHYYKGSLFFPMQSVHYYATRTPPGEKRDKIIEIGRREIERHINMIADQVLELYDALDPGDAG
ncbi:MAG: 6-hydroxymethylpterin diphosphokinase MptE-like protein [Rhodospirillales bacterium]